MLECDERARATCIHTHTSSDFALTFLRSLCDSIFITPIHSWTPYSLFRQCVVMSARNAYGNIITLWVRWRQRWHDSIIRRIDVKHHCVVCYVLCTLWTNVKKWMRNRHEVYETKRIEKRRMKTRERKRESGANDRIALERIRKRVSIVRPNNDHINNERLTLKPNIMSYKYQWV